MCHRDNVIPLRRVRLYYFFRSEDYKSSLLQICAKKKKLIIKVSTRTKMVFIDLNHLFLLLVKQKKTLLNEEDKCW